MAKITIQVTQEVDAFEVNGKLYKFVGNLKEFIAPNLGKITVEQALDNRELLAELVKTNSTLIEEIENAEVVEPTKPASK